MYGARPVRSGFSPRDEALALWPGQLAPRLHESVVRLGTWLPFAQAAAALAFVTDVTVSAASVRRLTEGAGAADEAVQTAAVERLERELPAAPAGPRVQLRSVDGSMVPLPHGAWAAVTTLALGVVSAPVQERGAGVVHTEELAYVSRLTDAQTFGRLALVETHRRGTETAKTGCAVSDGAEWIQGFIDLHRPDAVRILAVPQALARLYPSMPHSRGYQSNGSVMRAGFPPCRLLQVTWKNGSRSTSAGAQWRWHLRRWAGICDTMSPV